MIKNGQQRAVAVRRVEELTELAAQSAGLDRVTWLELAGDIRGDIAEYDGIASGSRVVFDVCSLDELGEAVVKARLARRWTQRQLAEELGVSEQMVQKDERFEYQSAGVARLADVVDALGYEFFGRLEPKGWSGGRIINGPTVWSVPTAVQNSILVPS